MNRIFLCYKPGERTSSGLGEFRVDLRYFVGDARLGNKAPSELARPILAPEPRVVFRWPQKLGTQSQQGRITPSD